MDCLAASGVCDGKHLASFYFEEASGELYPSETEAGKASIAIICFVTL